MKMNPVNNQFDDIILNRKSIRKYQPFDLSKETIESILTMALRAPSSRNFQPWTIRVILSTEAKEQYSHLFISNRSQYETASAMILLFADTRYASRADAIYELAVERGFMTPEAKEKQLLSIQNQQVNPVEVIKTAHLNTGLFAMSIMLSARHYGLDTCPIAGFDKTNAPIAFHLEHHEAILAISIGKALEFGNTSVRLPLDDILSIE
jgi:nitroreductase